MHNALLRLRAQRCEAPRTGFVAQEAHHAFGHEPLLPAPDSGFAGAAAAHNLRRAAAIGRQQDDARAPDVLLRAVAIRHNRLKLRAILGCYFHFDSIEHPADSHGGAGMGIL